MNQSTEDVGALNCWAEPRAGMTFEIRGRWPLIKRLVWGRFSWGAWGTRCRYASGLPATEGVVAGVCGAVGGRRRGDAVVELKVTGSAVFARDAELSSCR